MRWTQWKEQNWEHAHVLVHKIRNLWKKESVCTILLKKRKRIIHGKDVISLREKHKLIGWFQKKFQGKMDFFFLEVLLLI